MCTSHSVARKGKWEENLRGLPLMQPHCSPAGWMTAERPVCNQRGAQTREDRIWEWSNKPKFPPKKKNWSCAIIEPMISKHGIWKVHLHICLNSVLVYLNPCLETKDSLIPKATMVTVTKAPQQMVSLTMKALGHNWQFICCSWCCSFL